MAQLSITFLGHASFKFESDRGTVSYFDPWLDGQPDRHHDRRRGGQGGHRARHPRPHGPHRRLLRDLPADRGGVRRSLRTVRGGDAGWCCGSRRAPPQSGRLDHHPRRGNHHDPGPPLALAVRPRAAAPAAGGRAVPHRRRGRRLRDGLRRRHHRVRRRRHLPVQRHAVDQPDVRPAGGDPAGGRQVHHGACARARGQPA